MLEQLSITGFKSLRSIQGLRLPRLAVLFGPNAAGKSNLIDAVQMLSRLASSRTLADAFGDPIRGYPQEAFSFPAEGLPGLLAQGSASFTLDSIIALRGERVQYRITVEINTKSGALSVGDEYLAALTSAGSTKGSPSIERVGKELRIRRKSKPAHPRQEPLGLNHTLLSDPRLTGAEYAAVQKCRDELSGWRAYYLDPRVAMRQPKPLSEVKDVGTLGETVAPFLYYLKQTEPRRFESVVRTLKAIVPGVESVHVGLDERRAVIDIDITQQGVDFSTRIVSEGTLRVLALCALSANPWAGSLLAFEEPENGVHPRRLELVAELLVAVAREPRQVIVSTHSPLLCAAMLRHSRREIGLIELLAVRQRDGATLVEPFVTPGTLFDDSEVMRALNAEDAEGAFQAMLMRGLIDG